MGKWVLDASMGVPFCFCPIEGDIDGEYSIVIGLNVLADVPPGKLVAIVHEAGQDAVEEFCVTYAHELSELRRALSERKKDEGNE